MEILRFEEATPTAPKRKKSSKGYLTLGFVAALFSVGSAFATTTSSINVNNGQNISMAKALLHLQLAMSSLQYFQSLS